MGNKKNKRKNRKKKKRLENTGAESTQAHDGEFEWDRDGGLVLLGRIREALSIPPGENTLEACRRIQEERMGAITHGMPLGDGGVADVKRETKTHIKKAIAMMEASGGPYGYAVNVCGTSDAVVRACPNTIYTSPQARELWLLCLALSTMPEFWEDPFPLGVADAAQYMRVSEADASEIMRRMVNNFAISLGEEHVPGKCVSKYFFGTPVLQRDGDSEI